MRVSRPARRRGILLPLAGVVIAAVAMAGLALVNRSASADVASADTVGVVAAGKGNRAFVMHDEETTMRVTDIEVPGPAAGQDPGVPNRLGSAAVPVRVYEPVGEAWAALVWAHGGSFVRGTLDWPEADWVSRRFAEAGIRVYSVDYALASGSVKAPAPANDVAAVLGWVASREGGPVVAGGASAGAHLAALAALAQADLAVSGTARAADALILEYPTMHRVQRVDAAISAATAALPEQRRFDPDRVAGMYDFYLGEGGDVAGELPAERLALLPPTVIVNADADDLRASGEEFAEQLRRAGVTVSEEVQPGTVHGYLNRPEESARARSDAEASIARFVEELRAILG